MRPLAASQQAIQAQRATRAGSQGLRGAGNREPSSRVWLRAVRLLGCASVVLPAYRAGEAVRYTASLASLVLEETRIPRYEVIVVDDGSPDGGETLRAAAGAHIGPRGRLLVLRYEENRGKGFALTVGARHATCPYIAFLDGDGDIDPRQLLYILAPLHLYDAVITSKWHPESNTRASRLRRLLSHGYRGLTWLLTGLRLHDTQTGAKAFRRDMLLEALRRTHARRYSFDTELLAALHRLGARILEVPSKAPLSLHGRQKPRVILEMLLELLAIAYRSRARSPSRVEQR